MSPYIIMLSNTLVSFKVGLQVPTAQSTMEAEIVVAAPLLTKEAMFCSNMMELGFGEAFPQGAGSHRQRVETSRS